jgi:hypothetical protein
MHVAQCKKSATISHQSDTRGRLGEKAGKRAWAGHTLSGLWQVVAREEVSEQMKESQHVNAQQRARQSRGCRTLIELMETASRSSTVPGGSGSRHSSRGCTERFTIGMAANQPASAHTQYTHTHTQFFFYAPSSPVHNFFFDERNRTSQAFAPDSIITDFVGI